MFIESGKVDLTDELLDGLFDQIIDRDLLLINEAESGKRLIFNPAHGLYKVLVENEEKGSCRALGMVPDLWSSVKGREP